MRKSSRSFKTETCAYQPGVYPYALTALCYDTKILAQEPGIDIWPVNTRIEPDINRRISSFNKGYIRDTWYLGVHLTRPVTYYADNGQTFIQREHLESEGQVFTELAFTDLYRTEKDRILRHMKDEEIFVKMYRARDQAKDILDSREPVSPANILEPVSFLTTKPVLLPDNIQRGYAHRKGEMHDFLHQSLNPVVFHSAHFSRENKQALHRFAERKGYDFAPSQFVAIRHEGIENTRNREFVFNFNLQQEMPEFNVCSHPEREILFYQEYRAAERWCIYAVSPYNIQLMTVMHDIHESCDFLEQAENHFIDPFYARDPHLDFIDTLSGFAADFRPSHYSRITQEHKYHHEHRHFPNPN